MLFKPYMQNQPMLLPLSVVDCIPKGHFCFVLNDVVDNLDLSSIIRTYSESGSRAYHPALMIKVLFYAYTIGIRSSRKIEANLYENNVFRFLAGNAQIDHGTINLFRKTHLKEIPDIFAQIVFLAGNLGIADLSDISIDGTKIKACASRDALFDANGLSKLKSKITEILDEAEKIDNEEDLEFGEKGYNQIPEDLIDPKERKEKIKKLRKKLDRIAEGQKEIEEKQRKAKGKKGRDRANNQTTNLTDEDSLLMKMKDKSYKMAYNCQFASSNQIITGFGIVDSSNDSAGLIPMVEETVANTKKKVQTIKLDAGYFSKNNLQYALKNGIDAFIPDREKSIDEKNAKEGGATNSFTRKDFVYNEKNDEFICPEGKQLKFLQKLRDTGRKYKCSDCSSCRSKERCTSKSSRTMQIDFELEEMKKEMRQKLNSDEGRKIYNQRIAEVEPVIGNIKHNLNFTSFNTRGKPNILVELAVISTVHNLKKIFNYCRKTRSTETINWKSLMQAAI